MSRQHTALARFIAPRSILVRQKTGHFIVNHFTLTQSDANGSQSKPCTAIKTQLKKSSFSGQEQQPKLCELNLEARC